MHQAPTKTQWFPSTEAEHDIAERAALSFKAMQEEAPEVSKVVVTFCRENGPEAPRVYTATTYYK
jgi:hypothetical protein